MNLINRLIIIILFAGLSHTATAQEDSLRSSIEEIIKGKKAVVGVAVCPIGSIDTISINGTMHLPMLSVFKFHIALAVLDQVEKGKISLTEKIKLTKKELPSGTWSPIREKYPDANVSLTVAELIDYTIAQSDNNGCDILLRLIGGTTAVENYLRDIGAFDVEIKVDEQQMHSDWSVLYQNWTTPNSAVWLLSQFYSGHLVSTENQQFLYKIMTNRGRRLSGLLPEGTVVAHKTGSSDTDAQGITAATNDIGIITLPNGFAYAIAIFVSDSAEDSATNEALIAEISHTVWQYYLQHK